MNLQRHHQDSVALDLQNNSIYLAPDGAMRSYKQPS